MKCGIKEIRQNMNNEVDNVTIAMFDICQSDYHIHSKLTILPLF